MAARKKEQVTSSSQFSADTAQELPFSTKVLAALSLLQVKHRHNSLFALEQWTVKSDRNNFDSPQLHWIQGAELKVKTNLSFPLQFPTAV